MTVSRRSETRSLVDCAFESSARDDGHDSRVAGFVDDWGIDLNDIGHPCCCGSSSSASVALSTRLVFDHEDQRTAETRSKSFGQEIVGLPGVEGRGVGTGVPGNRGRSQATGAASRSRKAVEMSANDHAVSLESFSPAESNNPRCQLSPDLGLRTLHLSIRVPMSASMAGRQRSQRPQPRSPPSQPPARARSQTECQPPIVRASRL